MTSRAIGWQVQLLDGVSLLGGIGETVSHAKPLPNVKAQGMAGRSPCHSLPLLVRWFASWCDSGDDFNSGAFLRRLQSQYPSRKNSGLISSPEVPERELQEGKSDS
jgi:hypothetical protein